MGVGANENRPAARVNPPSAFSPPHPLLASFPLILHLVAMKTLLH